MSQEQGSLPSKDPRPQSGSDIARRLESAAAQEVDALLLAIADMEFVIGCCDLLLGDGGEDGDTTPPVEDLVTQRALWDAALVTFYKHFERPAHSAVVECLKSVRDAPNENVAKHFENWRRERHERIAHPVGKSEAYRVGVIKLPEGYGTVGYVRRLTRVEDSGVEVFRSFARLARECLIDQKQKTEDRLLDQLEELTDQEYKALKPLGLGDHRRIPGREDPYAVAQGDEA